MAKPEKPELIQADPHTRQSLFIILAVYILMLVWLEPLIDFLLRFDPRAVDPFAMAGLDQMKIRLTSLAYAAARSIPTGLFFWLGYRIVTSASLPPARMKFPFTVYRIKGKQARMFGLLLMSICMFLIYWEMVQLSRKLLA